MGIVLEETGDPMRAVSESQAEGDGLIDPLLRGL
jgi:hypothetical protein